MEDHPVGRLGWRDLGIRPYLGVWELQETIRADVLAGRSGGELLLTEHPPTISLGRAEKGGNLLLERAALAERGFHVVTTNRGGRVTYHGPGQLVAYPVVNLRRFKMGVKQYVAALEETMIRMLAKIGIRASRKEGAIGAWVKKKKIGSIGIHVRKQVSIHGLALNIHPDLGHFGVITPCGLAGVKMTSVREEGFLISMAEARIGFLDAFSDVYGCEWVPAVSAGARERKVSNV